MANAMAGLMFQDSIRARHSQYNWEEGSAIGVKYFQKGMLRKEFENGSRDIVGIATTDDVDESLEVVLPDGADWSYLNATKGLYADHVYGIGSLIGTIRYIRRAKDFNGWEFRASLYHGLRSPFADDCYTIMEQGGVLGTSIGFDAQEWGSPTAEEAKKYPRAMSIVRKWRGVELSLTPMQCNVTCRARLVESGVDGKTIELIENLVTKGKIRRETAIGLGLKHLNRGILSVETGKVPLAINTSRDVLSV